MICFFFCSNLATINLSNFDTSKVTDMNNMFGLCLKLEFINILNFSTSASKIYLFDSRIPLNGTIITNNNFKNKLDKTYINGWIFKESTDFN